MVRPLRTRHDFSECQQAYREAADVSLSLLRLPHVVRTRWLRDLSSVFLGRRRSGLSRRGRGARRAERFIEFDTGTPEFQRFWSERPEVVAARSQAEAGGDMSFSRETWPNQSVERTGMSRSVQCQLQRQRRLIPVAHLYRLSSFSLICS